MLKLKLSMADTEENKKPNDGEEKFNFLQFVKNHRKWIIISMTILGFGVFGSYSINQSTKKEPVRTSSIIDSLLAESEETNENGPVAVVNGHEISRLAYTNKLYELNKALTRQRFNTNNTKIAAQVRQQAVAELINFELLYQTAEARGFTASKSEIGKVYQELLDEMGSEEVLLLTLQDRNLTTTDLDLEIKRQLVVDKLIEAEIDFDKVSVSDTEAESYYANISVNNTDIGSYEREEVAIKQQLLEQKQQQLVTDFVQQLKNDAEIEILL